MTLRRPFSSSDVGVSAVISTILMVAVTVVLAATAFVLVADVGGHSATSAPSLGFRVDDNLDRLSISAAAQNADWSRLRIEKLSFKGTGAVYVGNGASPFFNEAAAVGSGDLTSPLMATMTTAKIAAGDYLEFCRASAGAQGAFQVRITDTVANAVIADYSMLDLHPCA
jgi:flagellin-like protein